MKGIAIVLVIVAAAALLLCLPRQNDDFLRVHIRANGDGADEQSLKLLVKDAIVEYLAPLVARCDTVAQSKKIVAENLDNIKKVAERTLKQNGCLYAVTLELKKETFPARSYGGITLASGAYDALIVNIGSGKGQNWWCVIYPPLCFVGAEANGTNAVRYRSKLLEIINRYFGAEN